VKVGVFMYLDPGFGSMLIQVLVASFAALAAMLGIFRAKIIAFFKRSKNTTEEISEEIANDE
jgi:hypothetical protein